MRNGLETGFVLMDTTAHTRRSISRNVYQTVVRALEQHAMRKRVYLLLMDVCSKYRVSDFIDVW